MLGLAFWPLGCIALIKFLQRKWLTRQKQQKLRTLLDGQAIEDVLRAAPYGYGHFQGEDGYRVWDKRIENDYVAFVYSPLDAELWIAEKFIAETDRGSKAP